MEIMASGLMALIAGLTVQAAPIQEDEFIPARWAESAASPYLEDGELPDPYFATIAGIAGRVRLDCLVSVEGTAEDCRVVAVAPGGLGFDRSALAQASDFRFTHASRGGRAEAMRVTFAVNFPEEEWPDQIDVTNWPRPPEAALEIMRPIAEILTRRNVAPKSDWQVDADREAVVKKLVEEIDQSQREARITTLAIALARSLSEDEAQALLDAPDYESARDKWDRVFAADPESQNEEGISRRMMRDRYCAIYDCASPLSPAP